MWLPEGWRFGSTARTPATAQGPSLALTIARRASLQYPSSLLGVVASFRPQRLLLPLQTRLSSPTRMRACSSGRCRGEGLPRRYPMCWLRITLCGRALGSRDRRAPWASMEWDQEVCLLHSTCWGRAGRQRSSRTPAAACCSSSSSKRSCRDLGIGAPR